MCADKRTRCIIRYNGWHLKSRNSTEEIDNGQWWSYGSNEWEPNGTTLVGNPIVVRRCLAPIAQSWRFLYPRCELSNFPYAHNYRQVIYRWVLRRCRPDWQGKKKHTLMVQKSSISSVASSGRRMNQSTCERFSLPLPSTTLECAPILIN